MKKNNGLLQKVWHHLCENPSEIIFGVYLLLIILTGIMYRRGYDWGSVIIFVFLLLLVPKFHRWIGKLSFTPPQEISRKEKIQVFCIAGGISFVILLFCFIGFYPGIYFPDPLCQYSQVINSSYDDWHPVWHTLLMFYLPLKLTGGWVGSIVLFQIIFFSLFIGYMAVLVYVYSGCIYAVLSVSFILLNPFTLELLMCPTKDVAFAMSAGVCMLWSVKVYFTKGQWCNKNYRIFLLAFMLASATLFRHNGILFSLFLVFALFFNMPRKSWRILNETTCIIFVSIKSFLIIFLNVGTPNNRTQEIMGLPLSVIINVAKECPESIDKQTSDFVAELMKRQPEWKTYHNIYGGLNSVKFPEDGRAGINSDAIEDAGVINISRMMCHCLIVAPNESLMGFIGSTNSVYGLDVACRWSDKIYKNDLGIRYKGVETIKRIEDRYAYYILKTPMRMISTIGFTILVMLAFILFKSNFRSFEDWKRILLCLPIFTYNFGTMLLLSGHDVRFFYVSFLVCPLVVLIMAGKRVKC